MLRFEMDVAATDLAARSILGRMVPYNEVGTIAGKRYRFRPGSVRLARARTPLLVDHNRSDPVGVLAGVDEREDGAYSNFTVDPTPAGDTALVQAASGSRGSLSVGAEIDDAEDVDGITEITAARIVEVSLLALGAFDGAEVLRVAAQSDEPQDEPQDEPDPDPDQTQLPDTEPAPPAETERTAPMETVEATAAAPVIITARDRSPATLDAGEYVHALLRAEQGDRDAARLIEAALTETVSTDIPGLLPPSYEGTVIGPAPVDRVLYETFRGRPLPGVGLAVQKPTWTTPPNGTWAANVDADATTSKAVIGLNAAAVERWDWATALSYTAAKRSSPDAITTMYGAAVEDFYKDVETKIANLAIASAGAANAAIKFGAGIAAFYTLTGRAPEVILVSPDIWGAMADAGALTPSVGFANANVGAGAGGLVSSYAGLRIVGSGALPPTTKLLATRRALDVRVSDPVQLTANAIGALNVELGVVGEGLFDADYATEIMLLTVGAPVMMSSEQEADYNKNFKNAK